MCCTYTCTLTLTSFPVALRVPPLVTALSALLCRSCCSVPSPSILPCSSSRARITTRSVQSGFGDLTYRPISLWNPTTACQSLTTSTLGYRTGPVGPAAPSSNISSTYRNYSHGHGHSHSQQPTVSRSQGTRTNTTTRRVLAWTDRGTRRARQRSLHGRPRLDSSPAIPIPTHLLLLVSSSAAVQYTPLGYTALGHCCLPTSLGPLCCLRHTYHTA